MGLFRREVRASNNPENPGVSLSDPNLLSYFGGSPSVSTGRTVTETGAIGGTIVVYRSISLLAGLVAGCPLHVFRIADKSPVVNRPLESPGYGQTPFELWETVMTHLLGWGNGYVYKHRNTFGAIDGLLPVAPFRVKPKILSAANSGIGEPVKVFDVKMPNGQYVQMSNYEIMHVPGLSYDGVSGLSPLGVARQAVGVLQSADELAGRLYANGNLISGILSTDKPLKQEQADAIKARWRDKMAGVGHAHDIAVLDAGMKFQPTALNPEEAQFLQTRRWQTIDLARLYGIPPHLVGDVEKSTSWGTGIEQQNIGLVSYTARPWFSRIEQRVSQELVGPSTQKAQFNVESLMRGDAANRAAFYSAGVQGGWLTRNEVRDKENLPPLEGLDEPLTPLNMGAGAPDAALTDDSSEPTEGA